MGGILTILSSSEILSFYLVNRLYLSVAVDGEKYCISDQVQRAIEDLYCIWKICHSELQNLKKFAVENCGP